MPAIHEKSLTPIRFSQSTLGSSKPPPPERPPRPVGGGGGAGGEGGCTNGPPGRTTSSHSAPASTAASISGVISTASAGSREGAGLVGCCSSEWGRGTRLGGT